MNGLSCGTHHVIIAVLVRKEGSKKHEGFLVVFFLLGLHCLKASISTGADEEGLLSEICSKLKGTLNFLFKHYFGVACEVALP